MAARQIVPNKTDLERLVRQGHTDGQIAALVGCSRSAIAMARGRYGIPATRPRGCPKRNPS